MYYITSRTSESSFNIKILGTSQHRGDHSIKQQEIHERTTTKPSPRRVGNDALFLYPDFVSGGCRRRVETTQKGAKHGQKKYESRHRRKCRFRSYAQPRRLARAYAYTRGMSYGDINNIPLTVIPRARAHVRKDGAPRHGAHNPISQSFATCRLQCSARLCASRFANWRGGTCGTRVTRGTMVS